MSTDTPNDNIESSVKDTANDAPVEMKEAEQDTFKFVSNLQILPPKQLPHSPASKLPVKPLYLPPMLEDEPVQALRIALGEILGYAHLTNYRFVLEPNSSSAAKIVSKPKSNGAKSSKKVDPTLELVSQFTGKDAVIMSVQGDEDIVHVNDYGDFRQLQEQIDALSSLDETEEQAEEEDDETKSKNSSKVSLRIILEKYTAGTVRDHIARFRMLINGENTPTLNQLLEEEDIVLPTEAASSSNGAVEPKSNESKASNSTSKKEEAKKVEEKQEKENEKALSQYSKSFALRPDTSNFSDYISKACGEVLSPSCCNDIEDFAVPYTVRYSGYHPPPAHRKGLGDLAYLEVFSNNHQETITITAVANGFYVNRCGSGSSTPFFDPTPAEEDCFSHELLDCVLKRSKAFRTSWSNALKAAKKRVEASAANSAKDNPLQSVLRIASETNHMDQVIVRPSWITSISRSKEHTYDLNRMEDDLSNMYGVERGVPVRDWNEELQSAREMPSGTLQERIDRAKVINKVLVDFADASVIGSVAIVEGQVSPMNPNEPTRSHVYLHNNIFFSRAVDTGIIDTYRVATGDRAAKKAASLDASSIGFLHKLDMKGLYSLATVVVDYLGDRFICQSVIPGILHGEHGHNLVYGAVEVGASIVVEDEMHKLMENSLGKNLSIAARKVPTIPLSDDRIAQAKASQLIHAGILNSKKPQEEKSMDESATKVICGPLEGKGIQGSDKRRYVLDLTRLSPRDANWLPESQGGTGMWEKHTQNVKKGKSGSKQKMIPETLDDDEWTMALLRQELVNAFIHQEMSKWGETKKEERITARKELDEEFKDNKEKLKDAVKKLSVKFEEEDKIKLESLRVNVNCFIPNTRSLEGIDDTALKLEKDDEDMVRSMSTYLFDEVLPSITKEIREGTSNQSQVPACGETLTDFLHTRGVNCRYIGRLATLAALEEAKDDVDDLSSEGVKSIYRRKMPLCWLEILECEMVARAGKHVLDKYLTGPIGSTTSQPSVIVAAFLSALVSVGEESAAETEKRLAKNLDNNDYRMTLFKPSIPSRSQIWADINKEVGRKFRYHLSLYNKSKRALLIPLLRRVSKRSGIRLAAKEFNVGGKCACRGDVSFPINSSDIIDILPMIKHSASALQGFIPYSRQAGTGGTALCLNVLLPDAKAAFDTASACWVSRALPQALDLTQEASSLYQKVLESALHPSIIRCLDLSAIILFQAQESKLAMANISRSLALSVQIAGFDSPEALSGHNTMSHILLSSGRVADAIKHLCASKYLVELMGGPRHCDLTSTYQRLGQLYFERGAIDSAHEMYFEALASQPTDRVFEGVMNRNLAHSLAGLKKFKEAVEAEKKAFRVFNRFLGEKHEYTTASSNSLKEFTKLAVEYGMKTLAEENFQRADAFANAMADQIIQNEKKNEKKKKSKCKKNKH